MAEYELVWSCVFEDKCCGIIFILDLVGFDSITISSSTFSNLFKCFVFYIILKIGPTRGDFPNICEKFARRVFCLKLWNPGVSGAVRSEDTIGRPDDSAHHTNTIFSRIQILYFQEYKYSTYFQEYKYSIFKNRNSAQHTNTLFSIIQIVHTIQILLILITVHTTQILRTTQYFWILMIVDTYSTADTADNTSFVH